MTTPAKIFDGLLVLQYRSGDQKALGLLVKRYHVKLCKHAYWYTQDYDAAKDIVQDCWSVIIHKIESLRNPNEFGSWAIQITNRKAIDYLHKNKKKRKEETAYRVLQQESIPGSDSLAEVEKLKRAIQDLSVGQQLVLDLFYKEEYSLKEISSMLDISVGTVKSRLFHAREKLKKSIKK